MAYVYDRSFFDYIDRGARRSAERMLRRGLVAFRPASVLDVGCGRGVWLSAWLAAGVPHVRGIDGPYVEPDTLEVPADAFVAADLSRPVDLGERFDIVQSLEVAEHLPPAAADTFIDTLCRHGDIVMFSAAQPGQGGENHLNEQTVDYWRERFAAHGYAAFDPVRPIIRHVSEIEPWYRYNTLIYANADGQARMPKEWLPTRIPGDEAVDPAGDLLWRLRRAVVRIMPRPVVTGIARVRAAALNARARRAAQG